ncbi:hypothetical protein LINPERPRIM_LOCUS20658 [Linum perenne]
MEPQLGEYQVVGSRVCNRVWNSRELSIATSVQSNSLTSLPNLESPMQRLLSSAALCANSSTWATLHKKKKDVTR